MLALESLVGFPWRVVFHLVREVAIVLQVIALATLAVGSARNVRIRKRVVHGNRCHVGAGEHALFLFVAASASGPVVTEPSLTDVTQGKSRDFDIVDIAVTRSAIVGKERLVRRSICTSFIVRAFLKPRAMRFAGVPVTGIPAALCRSANVLGVFGRRRTVRFKSRESICT